MELKCLIFGEYYMIVVVYVWICVYFDDICVEICNIFVSFGINLILEGFGLCVYYMV